MIKKTDNYLDLLKTSNASIKNDELKLKRGVISNLDFLNAKNEHLNIEKEAYMHQTRISIFCPTPGVTEDSIILIISLPEVSIVSRLFFNMAT